jgi:hypothetical protein
VRQRGEYLLVTLLDRAERGQDDIDDVDHDSFLRPA